MAEHQGRPRKIGRPTAAAAYQRKRYEHRKMHPEEAVPMIGWLKVKPKKEKERVRG